MGIFIDKFCESNFDVRYICFYLFLPAINKDYIYLILFTSKLSIALLCRITYSDFYDLWEKII